MQKARCHPDKSGLQPLVSTWFQVLLHSAVRGSFHLSFTVLVRLSWLGKVEAGKIITDAQQAINAQKMAAITEVKNEVGKMVVELSEKILKKELSAATKQEDYINSLVKEIKLS